MSSSFVEYSDIYADIHKYAQYTLDKMKAKMRMQDAELYLPRYKFDGAVMYKTQSLIGQRTFFWRNVGF